MTFFRQKLSQGSLWLSAGEMGSKGYNGCLSYVVRDITETDDTYILTNCGDAYNLSPKVTLLRELDNLLSTTEENDVFLQWFNCPLIQET